MPNRSLLLSDSTLGETLAALCYVPSLTACFSFSAEMEAGVFGFILLLLVKDIVVNGARLNHPRVLLPIFQGKAVNFTLEVDEQNCYKWYVGVPCRLLFLNFSMNSQDFFASGPDICDASLPWL